MKYPEQQFNKLVNILTELNKYVENLKEINYSHLHFIAYQQVSSGQQHNAFWGNGKEIHRQNFVESLNLEGYKRLFEIDDTFELYPNETNDNHIKTAIKNALKKVG